MVRPPGSSGQVLLQSGPNTAIVALLGLEFGSGLSSLTTSLASDLSNLGGTLAAPGKGTKSAGRPAGVMASGTCQRVPAEILDLFSSGRASVNRWMSFIPPASRRALFLTRHHTIWGRVQMETAKNPARAVEIIDPDNVPETVVTGPFNILRSGSMVLLTFTAVRHDPAAFFAGDKNPPSKGVIAARILMPTKMAREFVHALTQNLAAGTAPLTSPDGG
jgi:hypothetical protein